MKLVFLLFILVSLVSISLSARTKRSFSNKEKAEFARVTTKKLMTMSEEHGVDELCRGVGLKCEAHDVQTEDNYILTIHHIIPIVPNAPVVFLQHGLLDSSMTYMLLGNQSLAFLLAFKGFDVWLGNSRGNEFALRHKTLQVADAAFWAFDWDQMAQYDLPATIDYVLKATGHADLTYIGHSQGCTIAYALLGSSPEYQKKVNMFINMAPATFLGHLKLLLLRGLSLLPEFTVRLLLGSKAFMSSSVDVPFDVVCDIAPSVCHNILCLICGCNGSYSVPTAEMAFIIQHFPAGTSVQNMLHYTQAVSTGRFAKFDYGKKRNIEIYGNETSPSYNFEYLPIKLAFFYGDDDELADSTDVEYIISKQNPPLMKSKLGFGHGDFVWDPAAAQAVYQPILSLVIKNSLGYKSGVRVAE